MPTIFQCRIAILQLPVGLLNFRHYCKLQQLDLLPLNVCTLKQLRPPCIAGCGHIFSSCFFFLLFSSPNLSRRRLDVWHTPSANLKCRSGNAGPKKSPKSRHMGTIAQLCRAISLQLRHVSTIGRNIC